MSKDNDKSQLKLVVFDIFPKEEFLNLHTSMDSIGYYNSLPIECITVILMLIGTTNFSLLLLLFKGRIRDFCKSSEMHFLGGLILITIPILSGYATCSFNDWSRVLLQL